MSCEAAGQNVNKYTGKAHILGQERRCGKMNSDFWIRRGLRLPDNSLVIDGDVGRPAI